MRFSMFAPVWALYFILMATPLPARGQASGFDLAGPPVDVRVERAGKTLPIAEVPNLEAEDRVWIHPDFPDTQSARYLLIVAFLRGSTNPPPSQWFTKVETWNTSVRQEGIFVTVPAEAQQALIFLAPETAGDFSTLRAAVEGRPGAFVRAAQDLQQASLDRVRLERYLDEIKSVSDSDPTELQQRSMLLARSLKIKVDPKCFDKPAEQQASCLTQNADQLVLDDAHSQSMVARLANGATADLMNQISYSRLAGAGAYSAYVGAIVDFARIMGSIHSAQYQYIPALAIPHADSLSLKLNNPPSFRKPKSVLVISLPQIRKAQPPPLRAVAQNETYCASIPSLLLSTDGAPLVFATQLAHDVVLRVEDNFGRSVDLPAVADPGKGGFVVDTRQIEGSNLAPEVTGTLRGLWGFDEFQGPKFRFHSARPQNWTVAATEQSALIVGREDTLHLSAETAVCVNDVTVREPDGKVKKASWKATKPAVMEVRLPLQGASPGSILIEINQYGLMKPDQITMTTYAEAAEFDQFRLNIGDSEGTLEGKRLDEVSNLEIGRIRFEPEELKRRNNKDELRLKTQQRTENLTESQLTARVTLKDGRKFTLPANIFAPRPRVVLISKGVQNDDGLPSVIRLGSDDDLPVNGRIIFFIKTLVPASFPRTEKIEVAAADESFMTVLNTADRTLVLQDPQIAVAMLDAEKTLGPSAFGPVRFRPIDAEGRTGEWQQLGTLVRLPLLKELHCPPSSSRDCVLTGENLFLLTGVAADANFDQAAWVPDGFTEQKLQIPHPVGNSFYLKLRDHPVTVHTATMPIIRGTAATAASLPEATDHDNK